MDDNVLACLDSLDEVSEFTNKEKKQLKFRFKTRDVVLVKIPNLIKIYKFN